MHLPPNVMGFQHYGTEVFYNEAFDSYQVCDGSGEDEDCAGGFWLATS